jgi:hypothetical protein
VTREDDDVTTADDRRNGLAPAAGRSPGRLRRAVSGNPFGLCLLVPLAAVAFLMPLASVSVAATAPANDNYLASTRIGSPGAPTPRYFRDRVDTTAATVQADLFSADSQGLPLGGGDAEDTRCGSSSLGNSVWYDVFASTAGGVELSATGFDAVVSVYEWDLATSRIVRRVACQNRSAGSSEVIQLAVRRGAFYTVQIGGAARGGDVASGTLDFEFRFFADRDGDGALDGVDDCPSQPGPGKAGCPPELRPHVDWTGAPLPSGVRLTSLGVSNIPRGTRVEARCRQCGLRQARTGGPGPVALSRFVGRTLSNGSTLELWVTRAKDRSDRYRYGAVGEYRCYRVRHSSLAKPIERPLQPGSPKPTGGCR